jgi:hypothetical protein
MDRVNYIAGDDSKTSIFPFSLRITVFNNIRSHSVAMGTLKRARKYKSKNGKQNSHSAVHEAPAN